MKRIAQTVVAILLAPFVIILGLFVFAVLGIIALPLCVRGHFEHREWLRKMRSSGRTLTTKEIAERGGTGTLIVDNPGWGGNSRYLWWTPDDIESLSPVLIVPMTERIQALKFTIDDDALPFDRWIYNAYLSRDTGTAYLVTSLHGDSVASQMRADMVNLRLVETWSAPIRGFGTQNGG